MSLVVDRGAYTSAGKLFSSGTTLKFIKYRVLAMAFCIIGTSFVNGICSDSRSTSLVVDHGAYTSAGIGTHELGHK